MKTFYGWSSAPLKDRLSVYDDYVAIAHENGDEAPMSFEEFDFFWHTRSYYYVAAAYDRVQQ